MAGFRWCKGSDEDNVTPKTGIPALGTLPLQSLEGMARLPVTSTVAFLSFLSQALLHYLLPLYFSAKGLPRAAWETWSFYEIIAWLFTPPLAGILAARVGEKRTWAVGLAGYASVGICVWQLPSNSPWTEPILSAAGLLWGIASAMIWVGGISLVQNVPERRRGLSNVLMMTALGGGSIAGPIAGRVLVQWQSGISSFGSSHFDFAFAAFVVAARRQRGTRWRKQFGSESRK